MKKIYILFIWVILASSTSGQDCVDESLINPDAICPMIWAPVCGCDNVTYSNECVAVNYGGVTSWVTGECAVVNAGDCENISNVDFGPCDMWMGFAWNGATCVGVSGCGYISGNVDYTNAFYESMDSCLANCGSMGSCINQTQLEWGVKMNCTMQYDPVCGCDGVTYSNACHAYYFGGVTTYTLGECDDTTCLIVPSFVDFGDCDMPLGYVRRDGDWCEFISGCGYIGNNGYDYSDYFFQSSFDCQNFCLQDVETNCPDSSLIDLNMPCPDIYIPVCGCDSVTYSNPCEAMYYGGNWSYTQGECVNNVKELTNNLFSIIPNPAEDLVNINLKIAGTGWVNVFDVSGRLLIRERLSGSSLHTLNITALHSGQYVVQVIAQMGETAHAKLLKQ